MIIAQISDTHLSLDADDSARRVADFRAVIGDINTLDPQPNVIVHTGDIVQNGTQKEYAQARTILSTARAPVYAIPGNKDDRQEFQNALSEFAPCQNPDFIHFTVEGQPFRLIFIDTMTPVTHKGDFCEARFAWLQKTLSGAENQPTLIFMHHPPFEVTVGPERDHFNDQKTANRLVRLIGAQSHVRGVFCGHVHRPTTGCLGPVPAVIAPAVATPVRFGDYPDHMASRPIYFVHRVSPDGSFTTETQIAGRWF